MEDVDIRGSMGDVGGETITGWKLDAVELGDEGETERGVFDGERVDHRDVVWSEHVGQGLEGYVEGAGAEGTIPKVARAEAVQQKEANTGSPDGRGNSAMDRTANILEELGERDGGESSETDDGLGVEGDGELSVRYITGSDAGRESREEARGEGRQI